jgi:hypothetical protein
MLFATYSSSRIGKFYFDFFVLPLITIRHRGSISPRTDSVVKLNIYKSSSRNNHPGTAVQFNDEVDWRSVHPEAYIKVALLLSSMLVKEGRVSQSV